MEKLQSDQHLTTILPPATAYHPVDGRKYSLIMSTREKSCHLAIGFKYEWELLELEKEDIFLMAEWKPRLGEYLLTGKAYIGNNSIQEDIQEMLKQINGLLTKAISKIVIADQQLFSHVPWLLDAPIYIEMETNMLKTKTIQYFDTPRQFLRNR